MRTSERLEYLKLDPPSLKLRRTGTGNLELQLALPTAPFPFIPVKLLIRSFALTFLAFTALTVLGDVPVKRPNIIFLMDDQRRWDALGCIDPAMKTPALDRLAKDGILFDQAVCQAPMCIPSRYSMMLGLYPHQIGILSNGPGLTDEQLPCDTLPELLRKAGYQTAGFGKTHWLAREASTRGFEVRYSSTDGEKGTIMMSKDNPEGLKRYNDEVASYGDGEEWPAGYLGRTSQVPEGDHRDGWTFNKCLEFLDKGVDKKRPLFLYLSFLKPHAAANVPPGYEDLYKLSEMPIPKQPPMEQVEPCHATGSDRQEMYRSFWSQATPEQWQQMILRYRANCSWIDSMFGRVMDKLRTEGLLENCLIVYVSDHGEMLGERYYRFNKYCLFDASARVPMILSGTAIPAEKRGVIDHRMAEEVDIYPTLAAIAGLPAIPNKPGENLLGPSVRKAGFCEYSDRPEKVAFMWRTSERKLILTFPKTCIQKGSVSLTDVTAGEFYDLKSDPKEWKNLYAKDEYKTDQERMAAELVSHLNTVALKKDTCAQGGDQVIADFEGPTYGEWKTEGTAFGTGPAQGTLKGQMKVDDFQGKGLVNSFLGGDRATGTLTSPAFKIEQKFITFLIGGGGWEGKTCMNLLVDNKVVRTAIGPNVNPGGSEALEPGSWDVSDLIGKEARIQIVDQATGGWGHINVDKIVLSDKATALVKKNAAKERELTINKRYLHFPVHNGAKKGKKQRIAVLVDGAIVREFEADMSEEPDWYAHMDMSAWQGKKATIRIDKVPEDSKLLEMVALADTIWNAEQLYKEPLRAQLHFSPRRGWNNDPNGMVYADGEYHLYFQANPYGWPWGNMHWGHAVSKDMVHWEELPIALYPQKFGDWAFSGGAVVDKDNTSGWKKGTNSLIVATYTSTGRGECIVYSNDRGRTFQEYEGNPIIKHGGRDPLPRWYAPGNHWVIAVYDECQGGQYVAFYTSTDMKTWTFQSRIAGFYECADLFELPVGDKKYWIVTAANSDYMVGQFDGKTFTPETPKLKGHLGRAFYAAQTFSNEPKGRTVQIGWLQTATPGMPFNQAMSLPNELKLRQTAEGPRLTWTPVKELESLRDGPDQGAALADFKAELMEVRASFEPSDAETIELTIRGAKIVYDVKKQEISVNNVRAPAPLVDGKQNITVYVDKTALEIFASDGLTYIPLPFVPKADDLSVSIEEKGGKAKGLSLKAYALKSCWRQ